MIPSPQNTPHPLPDCDAVGERLSAYLDGELTEGEKKTVQAHLQTCDACRQLADALVNLRREISTAELTPPPSLRGAIMTRVHRENRLRRIRRLTAVSSVGAAAMLCFVILGNALLGTLTSADKAAPEAYHDADMAAYALSSQVEVMDATIEAELQRAGTAAPAETATPAGKSAAGTTTTSTTEWTEEVIEPVCTAAPEAAATSPIVTAILPDNLRSIPLSDALAQSNAPTCTPPKADDTSGNPADTLVSADTLQEMMQDPRASLAEQQMGILCIVELNDGKTVYPYVYSLTDGRRLTLADFLGDAFETLSATFPIAPNTPFCPTAEGLILWLPESETVTLVWIAFPALTERAAHFGMNETPILAPEGSRIIP